MRGKWTTDDGLIDTAKIEKVLLKQCKRSNCKFLSLDAEKLEWKFQLTPTVNS
jgi:hypothetical protein